MPTPGVREPLLPLGAMSGPRLPTAKGDVPQQPGSGREAETRSGCAV